MSRKRVLQLVIPLMALGVLFSLVAFDLPLLHKTPEPLEVSVLFRTADSSAWSVTRQGMEQAAVDFGVELRFLSLSTDNDAAEQRDLLEREISGGADGVILVPASLETSASEDAVRQAASKAALVTLESDLSAYGARACLGVDNDALGKALGQAVLNGVPEGGTVLLLDSAPSSPGISTRLDAARRVLEAADRVVQICRVSETRSLGDAFMEALQRYQPRAVLVFEATALELAARTAQNWEEPPLLYGMGATAVIAAYLEQSRITAIAAQNEFSAGYLAVQAVVRAAQGGPVASVPPLAFTMVRQETMYDPDNQKLLFPVT